MADVTMPTGDSNGKATKRPMKSAYMSSPAPISAVSGVNTPGKSSGDMRDDETNEPDRTAQSDCRTGEENDEHHAYTPHDGDPLPQSCGNLIVDQQQPEGGDHEPQQQHPDDEKRKDKLHVRPSDLAERADKPENHAVRRLLIENNEPFRQRGEQEVYRDAR